MHIELTVLYKKKKEIFLCLWWGGTEPSVSAEKPNLFSNRYKDWLLFTTDGNMSTLYTGSVGAFYVFIKRWHRSWWCSVKYILGIVRRFSWWLWDGAVAGECEYFIFSMNKDIFGLYMCGKCYAVKALFRVRHRKLHVSFILTWSSFEKDL